MARQHRVSAGGQPWPTAPPGRPRLHQPRDALPSHPLRHGVAGTTGGAAHCNAPELGLRNVAAVRPARHSHCASRAHCSCDVPPQGAGRQQRPCLSSRSAYAWAHSSSKNARVQHHRAGGVPWRTAACPPLRHHAGAPRQTTQRQQGPHGADDVLLRRAHHAQLRCWALHHHRARGAHA